MEFVDFTITIPARNIRTEEVTLSLPRVEMREEDIIRVRVIRTSNFMLDKDEEALCVTRISKLQLGYFIMALAEATKHEIVYSMARVYMRDPALSTSSTPVVDIEIYDDYRE